MPFPLDDNMIWQQLYDKHDLAKGVVPPLSIYIFNNQASCMRVKFQSITAVFAFCAGDYLPATQRGVQIHTTVGSIL